VSAAATTAYHPPGHTTHTASSIEDSQDHFSVSNSMCRTASAPPTALLAAPFDIVEGSDGIEGDGSVLDGDLKAAAHGRAQAPPVVGGQALVFEIVEEGLEPCDADLREPELTQFRENQR
jgi:hypothetical protein